MRATGPLAVRARRLAVAEKLVNAVLFPFGAEGVPRSEMAWMHQYVFDRLQLAMEEQNASVAEVD